MKILTLILSLAACLPNLVYSQHSRVIETRTLRSEILGMERRYSVYLPACYDVSDRSYPVLYLLHGSGDDHTGWVQFGQVHNIADRVIAEGLAGPMIIVMPDANTGVRGYFNTINGNFNYEDFFFDELIPHIEKTYRVRSERRYRAISGLSMGGGGTIFYALHRPNMFAAAAPLSAATGNWDLEQFRQRSRANNNTMQLSDKQIEDWFNRHSIESLIKNATEDELRQIKSVRWYISNGDDDFLYEGNARLHILFRQNDIPHQFRIKEGGHNWTYWRMELPIVMEFVAKSFMQH